MPITTGHHKVRIMKVYRRPRQYIYHHSQLSHVSPGLSLLVSVCTIMLPMLGLVDEHAQLTTVYHMYHMNLINKWNVHSHHMTFRHTALVLILPSLDNVLPAVALQNRVVWSNIGCPSYTSSHSGVCPTLPFGLGRRVVGMVLVLLLLLSGDIETNPGPVLTVNDLRVVMKELNDVRAKWNNIGVHLGVSVGTLDAIKKQYSDPSDCLRETLTAWLKSSTPGWTNVVDALNIVGEARLAAELEHTYCSTLDPAQPSTSQHPTSETVQTVTIPQNPVQPAVAAGSFPLIRDSPLETSPNSHPLTTPPPTPAEATAQSPRSSWTSRLGSLWGHGVTLVRRLFNPTSDHPTLPPEMPVTTQPVTVTTTSQHPAQQHTALLDRQTIKQQVKQLQDHFIRLKYCTYEELADKGISVHSVHAWLISLDVFRQREHQEFIKDHLTNTDKETHLNNLWARLGTYWNFLNFDLLEHFVSGFGSERLNQKMESYKCDLQSFRKATRICDFINCWPERVEPFPEHELRQFVAKVGYHWENCTLEDLDMIEGVITRRFLLPRFVLQLREIKPGSITITWLIPVPFVKELQEAIESTSSSFFMERKIETITVDGQECYPTVEQHIKQLESRFLDLVYCTRTALVDNGINVDKLHGWLVALDVSQKNEHQEFIDNHLMNIHQHTTFSYLWAKLGKYWDFLNFDLLEHVINKFGSEDLKHKMKSYKYDLQSFRRSTRLCDFIHCWPVQGQTPPETELREFIMKVGHQWDSCTLEDLESLKGVITQKFSLPEFTLRLKKLTEGSITITWLIPVPFVKILQEAIESTSSEFFTKQKIETITVDGQECYPTVEQHIKQLESRFRDLVYCTHTALVDNGINVGKLHGWLVALDVSQKHEHQEFIDNHLMNIHQDTTFSNLWAKLGKYWDFLNFDLLEHVINKFGSEDHKHKMKSYKHDLQSFRRSTRLCDFIHCWPVQGQTPPETELREFIMKVGHQWDSCTLEDLESLKGVITRKFFLPEFTLRLKKLTEGSITITWLIPVPFVKTLQEAIESTSSEFFTEQKIETITVDGQECYPTHTENPVAYLAKQLTSKPEPEIQQIEDPSVGVVSKKFYSSKSRASEEQAFPKETHRMRLAEEILFSESTSSVPSEKIQFDTQPGETKRDTKSSSFLGKLKRKIGIRHTTPSEQPSKYQRMPYTSDSPTLSEMESLSKEFPKPHIYTGGTKPSYSSSYSSSDPEEILLDSPRLDDKEELSLMPKAYTHLGSSKLKRRQGRRQRTVKDVRRGLWVDPPTPAEKYVSEKCVDEISRPVKLVPSVEQYLSKAEVDADPSLPTKYKDYLTSTPVIRAALYTTFYAKMAAEVFTWNQHTKSPPPTTMTKLFTAFTLKTLVDHLSTHPVYHKQQLKVTTFSDLPTDVYKQFQDLCRMAYEGILNRQQLVFSAAHLPTGFAPLGLMQEVPQLYTEGTASSYHFIHFTLQEYLAAVHISQLPAQLSEREQKRLFQEHADDFYSDHLKMTLSFLTGLTKLINIPREWMPWWVRITCFHILFERNDISITTETLGSNEREVSSRYSWTPLDYYVTGHAISHSDCSWKLDFLYSSFDDEKLELFCQGCAASGRIKYSGHISHVKFGDNDITIKGIQSFVNTPPHILQNMRELHLGYNKLDGSACDLLAKAVTSMSRLEELFVGHNPIGSGGAVEVIKALCGSGVKQLWLWNTEIGEPDCEALCELLKSSHSLQLLHIEKNNLSSESVASIITGLSHNSSLTTLDISHSHFSMANVDSLASVLKDHSKCTLTWLYLEDCHISSEGAVELTAAICKNSTLKHLHLDYNPIGVEGASSVSDMLQHNTSLEELWLCDGSVGKEGVHQLINSLKHNQTLKELWLLKKYKSETSDHRIRWWW